MRSGFHQLPYTIYNMSRNPPWRSPPAPRFYYVTVPDEKSLILSRYPHAQWQSHKDPFGREMFGVALIEGKDIVDSTQAARKQIDEHGKKYTLWEGTLYEEGKRRCTLSGPREMEYWIWLDGELVSSAGQTTSHMIDLQPGGSALKVKLEGVSGDLFPPLTWKCDSGGSFVTIPADRYYNFASSYNGLDASYYREEKPEGVPYRIDRAESFSIDEGDKKACTIVWRGFLCITCPGLYIFGTSSDHYSSISIDDQLVAENGSTQKGAYQEKAVALTAGYHPITIRYSHKEGEKELGVFWQPPGGERESLSMDHLFWKVPPA